MIVTKLTGGLGNQMFQYALARSLAQKNKCVLKIDVAVFEQYELRQFELKHFNIIENIASVVEISEMLEAGMSGTGRLLSLFKKNKKKLSNNYVREKYYHYDPSVIELGGDLYLDGYWQSEKYFSDIKSVLYKEFSLKSDLSIKSSEVEKEIQSCESISLHIRRGDYISNATTNEFHGVCGPSYYSSAIKYFKDRLCDCQLFVFSDDPIWVKENLSFDYPATYVGHNDAGKCYEDLYLMSKCRHQITANSSFSWWGAWLNSNPNKIVITPRQWFSSREPNTDDLIPDAWLRL